MHRALVLTLASLTLAAPALGVDPHTDILLILPPGGAAFTTGAYDFNNPGHPITLDVRVFKGHFGEAGQPDFTDDPGFTAPSGSLPHSMLVGFDISDAVRVWDGSDFDALSPSTITCERFTSFVTSPLGAGQVASGFWLDTTGTTGGIHVHMSYFIDPPAAAGIYLLRLQLRTSAASIVNPAPVYIVFDNSSAGGAGAVDAAAAYVQGLLPPGPACAGDINGDGTTNVADFNILAGHFSASVSPHTGGDLNGDGLVNVADFNILAGNFGCSE